MVKKICTKCGGAYISHESLKDTICIGCMTMYNPYTNAKLIEIDDDMEYEEKYKLKPCPVCGQQPNQPKISLTANHFRSDDFAITHHMVIDCSSCNSFMLGDACDFKKEDVTNKSFDKIVKDWNGLWWRFLIRVGVQPRVKFTCQ